jgi:hypothetical protein
MISTNGEALASGKMKKARKEQIFSVECKRKSPAWAGLSWK